MKNEWMNKKIFYKCFTNEDIFEETFLKLVFVETFSSFIMNSHFPFIYGWKEWE